MFTRDALEQLINDKTAFQQVQHEATEANNPNHLQSKLKFAMCQIYGLGIPKEIIQGVDRLFDVYLNGKDFSVTANKLLVSIKQICLLEELSGLFEYYNNGLGFEDVRAQTILGFLCGHGIGIPNDTPALKSQNCQLAVGWYSMAAVQNYAPAQTLLGWHYQNGIGVPNSTPALKSQNQQLAVDWYRVAVAQNYAPVQAFLGYYYEKGIGVPNNTPAEQKYNHQKAIELYTLSASLGYEGAKMRLSVIPALAHPTNPPSVSTQNKKESASKRQRRTYKSSISDLTNDNQKTVLQKQPSLIFQGPAETEQNFLHVLAQAAEQKGPIKKVVRN